MKNEIQIQEFAVVLVAKNHNPTILNPDFLKYNEIVPSTWKLASPPVCAAPIAQVSYKNGLNVTAQLEKVIILENLTKKSIENCVAPEVAIRYVETLPHVDYNAVGINPKGHVPTESITRAQRYILDKYVTPGPWKSFRGEAPRISLNFSYSIHSGILTLGIESSFFSPPQVHPVPAISFVCNIHRDLKGTTTKDRVSELKKIVELWKEDVKMYRSLVNDTFLKEEG